MGQVNECYRTWLRPSGMAGEKSVLSQILNAPQHWIHFLYGLPPLPLVPDPDDPVTAIYFYRVIFPLLILGILVALPLISGMRRNANIPRKLRLILLLAASVSLMTMLFRGPGFGLLLGASERQWFLRNHEVLQILLLVPYWPTLYVIVARVRRYRRHKAALV